VKVITAREVLFGGRNYQQKEDEVITMKLFRIQIIFFRKPVSDYINPYLSFDMTKNVV